MTRDAPRIVVTAGEPAGIGPDICAALGRAQFAAEIVVLGDLPLLRQRAGDLHPDVTFEEWRSDDAAAAKRGSVRVLHEPLATRAVAGKPDPANANHVLKLLDRALAGIADGAFDAMVTAPVQKSVINQAGVPFSGHTEYLAHKLGTPRPVMLLVSQQLRVALATTHLPLRAVPDAIDSRLLDEVLTIIDQDLRRLWGIARPRIAVCGLNPHAGESGHLGDEEQRVIGPAIDRARRSGLDVTGPMPADTVLVARTWQTFDVVLAMYHDQGLPALKHASFGQAVNVTLGLPIIRTSVDHGTALDIAGSGRADSGSLEQAVALAIELAEQARRGLAP
ncbi:MAG TPA: 4-hydroxythreonine-4-phosphate dehydrogenase PdxA [Steroidobacteraceae bacterium]|mgnify:CR=1 FL=1|nr:4-hydroxythreonine-4-phosphate dehydrogenase PdxA [Steroidobacteraceae bacterium]HRX87921.1 4-hydroxythreonine-4-phosphate dehydrogenase PdxA [Steroidobacteraceae bacterium]